MWSARYPIKLMNTLADKFNEITEKYLPEPKAPDITYPHGDLTKKDVELLINGNYGQLLTSILGKVKQ